MKNERRTPGSLQLRGRKKTWCTICRAYRTIPGKKGNKYFPCPGCGKKRYSLPGDLKTGSGVFLVMAVIVLILAAVLPTSAGILMIPGVICAALALVCKYNYKKWVKWTETEAFLPGKGEHEEVPDEPEAHTEKVEPPLPVSPPPLPTDVNDENQQVDSQAGN